MQSNLPLRQRGFTLIEVLIALAILSIALTAIIKAAAENIKDTAYIQDKSIATWVATEIMNEARIGLIELHDKTDSTEEKIQMLGVTWYWNAYFIQSPNPRIKEIHVAVRRKSESAPLATLVSYRYEAN